MNSRETVRRVRAERLTYDHSFMRQDIFAETDDLPLIVARLAGRRGSS
jgi:hypothetical protein